MFLAIPEHKQDALKDKWNKDRTQSQLARLPINLKWDSMSISKNNGSNWLMSQKYVTKSLNS